MRIQLPFNKSSKTTGLEQMVLGQWEQQAKKIGLVSHIIHKNELKMNDRPNCKS